MERLDPALLGTLMRTLSRLASLCALAFAALPATGAGQPGPAASQAAGSAPSRAAVAPGRQDALPAKRVAARADVPASTASASDAPATWWHDGERRRDLRIDPAQVADFRTARAGKSAPLRARSEAEKNASSLPAGMSPVFVDPGAPGQVRALPGGVIVTLKRPPAGNDAAQREADGRRQLAAAGLQPLRPIGPDARRWLVGSPAGMPALELANRLHDSGDFESAAPNWWQPRALK